MTNSVSEHSLTGGLNLFINKICQVRNGEELFNYFCRFASSLVGVDSVGLIFNRKKDGQVTSLYCRGLNSAARDVCRRESLPLIKITADSGITRPNEAVDAQLSGNHQLPIPVETLNFVLYPFEIMDCCCVVAADKSEAGAANKDMNLCLLPVLTALTIQQYHLLLAMEQQGNENLKQLQEELTHSENRLAFVLNSVADGILTFSPDNRIIMANREAEKIWGYEPGTLEGIYVHKLLEETENAPAALINFLLNPSGESEILGKTFEFTGFRKNRTKFPLEARIQQTIIGGSQYFTAAVSDITERKRILADLVAAKNEAEESTRNKEEFLAHISHEIRTPLNAIVGYTSLLMQANPAGETLEFLSSIKISAENLSLLINDVLDISKIRAGKIEFTNYQFSLSDVFTRIFRILSGPADEKNISLSYDIDPAAACSFSGDAVRLSQILLNLTANAVKYTNSGSVFYSAELIDETEREAIVLFRVKDTGIGIPEDKLKYIFRSFARLSPDSSSTGGSGLGLTIASELVKLLGGELAVSSTQNQGSTFSFELKLQKFSGLAEPSKQYGFSEQCSVDLEKIRILLVEDNKLNAAVIEKLLHKWNALYRLAGNGSEAVAMLQKEQFDIILMDISMPVLNGYDATRLIRTTFPEPVRSVPIVGLTATAFLEDKSKMVEAGMNDYITKPFQPMDLIGKIIKCTGIGRINNTNNRESISIEKPLKSTDVKVINLNYLYQAFGNDTAGLREFISDVLVQVPDGLALIYELSSTGEIDELKKNAHKLKSVFRYLGMDEISACIVRFENTPEDSITANILAEFTKLLNKAWEEALPELMREVGNMAENLQERNDIA